MATLIDVIEQVRSRVAPGVDETLLQEYDFIIAQSLPNALRTAASKVAESSDESVRTQLQKEFTVTLTAGKGSLASSLSAAEPMLVKFPFIRVEHSTLSYPLQPVPSLFRLQIEPANPDFGSYTVQSNQIHTKNTTGSLTSLTGNLSVTSQYIPTLALLPNTLLPILVEEVVLALKGISFESQATSLLESYPGTTE
jgi:hypothetical protein